MSSSSIARVPHKHVEVIKAWADDPNLVIEWRCQGGSKWYSCDAMPAWDMANEYRVKPEKVYPESRMTHDEIWDEIRKKVPCQFSIGVTNMGAPYGPNDVERAIANAALRHAIDANQIISMADHQDGLVTLGQNLRDVEITRHANRDRRIAEAVRGACYAFSVANGTIDTRRDIGTLDLATIIAKVRP